MEFAKQPCAVCGKESKIACFRCNATWWCNRTHLQESLQVHKTICRLIPKLQPVPETKLALYFPHKPTARLPQLIWTTKQEIKAAHHGSSEPMHPQRTDKGIGHHNIVGLMETMSDQGVNASIVHLTRGEYKYTWVGPIYFLSESLYGGGYEDFVPNDFYAVVKFLTDYKAFEVDDPSWGDLWFRKESEVWTVALRKRLRARGSISEDLMAALTGRVDEWEDEEDKEDEEHDVDDAHYPDEDSNSKTEIKAKTKAAQKSDSETANTTVHGVIILRVGEQRLLDCAKFLPVTIPKSDVMSGASPVFDHLKLPIAIRLCKPDMSKMSNPSYSLQNRAGRSMSLILNHPAGFPYAWEEDEVVGNVLLVRTDGRDIDVRQAEALSRFCQFEVGPAIFREMEKILGLEFLRGPKVIDDIQQANRRVRDEVITKGSFEKFLAKLKRDKVRGGWFEEEHESGKKRFEPDPSWRDLTSPFL